MEQLLGLVLLFERFEVGRDDKIMIIYYDKGMMNRIIIE